MLGGVAAVIPRWRGGSRRGCPSLTLPVLLLLRQGGVLVRPRGQPSEHGAHQWVQRGCVMVRYTDDPSLLQHRWVVMATDSDMSTIVASPDREASWFRMEAGPRYLEVLPWDASVLPLALRFRDIYMDGPGGVVFIEAELPGRALQADGRPVPLERIRRNQPGPMLWTIAPRMGSTSPESRMLYLVKEIGPTLQGFVWVAAELVLALAEVREPRARGYAGAALWAWAGAAAAAHEPGKGHSKGAAAPPSE